jgi:thiol:disulfide interchange protein
MAIVEPHFNHTTSPTGTLQIVEPAEINQRLAAGDSFVVNIVTTWCPDCTVRQAPHIDGFTQKMASNGIDVLQVNVQMRRGEFISLEHEQITHLFGGHGYPRTVLIKHGTIADHNNVEILSEEALSTLAQRFLQQLG